MTTPLPIHGVDISHYQGGTIDWKKAKDAGVRFVFHKATQGATYQDPNYGKRRSEVHDAGLIWGAYHYLEDGNATLQARHFMNYAKLRAGNLWPVLDYEADGLVTSQFADFLDECKRLGAPGVILYTYTSKAPSRSFKMPLWLARYSNTNLAPEVPSAWADTGYWMHQFSDGVYGLPHSVPGIGNCDINTLHGGLKTLDAYVWKA